MMVRCNQHTKPHLGPVLFRFAGNEVSDEIVVFNKSNSAICDILRPQNGDIVMTGTPVGVGTIHTGQDFCGRILQGTEILTEAIWVAQQETL